MSLIVSLTTLDNVIMGVDSGTYDTDHGVCMNIADRKIFRQGIIWDNGSLHFLAGCAGSVRQRQVMQHSFTPPQPPRFTTLTSYMVSQYAPALYQALDDAHALSEDEPLGGTAMLAVYGTGEANHPPHVYELMSDLQVAEVDSEWNATGANYPIALGALAAMDFFGRETLRPEDSVRLALEVTERYSMYCRGPFHIERLIED